MKLSFFSLLVVLGAAGVACAAGTEETSASSSANGYGYGTPDSGAATADASSAAVDVAAPPAVDAGPPAVVPFTQDEVQALFTSKCTPCHIAGASAGMSLVDFTATALDVASAQVPTMKRIAPGDKNASYLFHKVAGTHLTVGGSGLRMPRNGNFLADTDIARLGAYIDSL